MPSTQATSEPAQTTYKVSGAIAKKYQSLGGEKGKLGKPTANMKTGLKDGGMSQQFEHGRIYWSPKTGAWAVTGPIQNRWRDLGWENGQAGYPTSDETKTANGGVYQLFQHGTMYWTSSTGAHFVHDGIFAAYGANGFERGNLGYPTSDEYDSGKGRAQNFQHGALHWYGCGKNGWQNPSQYFQVSSCDVSVPQRSIFGYASPSRIGMSATREQAIEAMIGRAYDYLGTRYVWDYALQPGVGVDCAGLVMQSLYATGMDLKEYNPTNHWYDPWHSHDANNMAADARFKHVPLAERQRGDLIFWPGHVAIYLGNDQIIEANVPSVRLNNMWNNGTPTAVARPFV